MSKLLSSFDLHHDLKFVDQLENFIKQFKNPQTVMDLMIDEIKIRDIRISEFIEKIVVLETVNRIQKDLYEESKKRLNYFETKFPHPYEDELQ